ncbi:hypothetical protein FA95DRAFT_672516 [Auriscalpium vulgare]|uniref:Uncharacterized protein n=1 Tax=Auriscalpium vulgare TaxID=40419 RepID=A0ACB8RDH7_9AGAM|nr:hypothetical protein FA95DRAFT_672516 [Auriscalpium vulgare]
MPSAHSQPSPDRPPTLRTTKEQQPWPHQIRELSPLLSRRVRKRRVLCLFSHTPWSSPSDVRLGAHWPASCTAPCPHANRQSTPRTNVPQRAKGPSTRPPGRDAPLPCLRGAWHANHAQTRYGTDCERPGDVRPRNRRAGRGKPGRKRGSEGLAREAARRGPLTCPQASTERTRAALAGELRRLLIAPRVRVIRRAPLATTRAHLICPRHLACAVGLDSVRCAHTRNRPDPLRRPSIPVRPFTHCLQPASLLLFFRSITRARGAWLREFASSSRYRCV